MTREVPKPSKSAGRGFMFLGGFLMGFVGLFVTTLGTPSHVTACLRGIFGSLFLTFFFIARKQLRQVKVVKIHWGAGILLAASNASTILFYFITIQLAGLAFGAFMLYTGGAFAVIFVHLFLSEKVHPWHYIAFALATFGVALIMEFWNGFQWNLAIMTGLISGVSLGGNTLSKKMYYKRLDNNMGMQKMFPETPTVLAWWATFTLGAIFFIPSVIYFAGNPFPNIGVVLLLGLLPTALAFSCANYGLRADEGGDVLILSYIEPVVATILQVLLGQPPSIFLYLGGTAITAANIIILFARPRK